MQAPCPAATPRLVPLHRGFAPLSFADLPEPPRGGAPLRPAAHVDLPLAGAAEPATPAASERERLRELRTAMQALDEYEANIAAGGGDDIDTSAVPSDAQADALRAASHHGYLRGRMAGFQQGYLRGARIGATGFGLAGLAAGWLIAITFAGLGAGL